MVNPIDSSSNIYPISETNQSSEMSLVDKMKELTTKFTQPTTTQLEKEEIKREMEQLIKTNRTPETEQAYCEFLNIQIKQNSWEAIDIKSKLAEPNNLSSIEKTALQNRAVELDEENVKLQGELASYGYISAPPPEQPPRQASPMDMFRGS